MARVDVVERGAAVTLDLFTPSRAKAARSCRRFHKLRYLDGYKPAKDNDDARFGTLMHFGFEAWFRARPAERLGAALDAIRAAKVESEFERAKAEILMIGYDTRWSEEPLEVLAVEVEFEGPLVNPQTGSESRIWQRAGKIDAVVRDRRDGRVLVVEHKTSSEDIRQGSEYWRRLRIDGQVSAYFEGGRFLGHDVAGCLYDVVAKPGQRPLKATPEESRKYTKKGELYANQRDQDETVQEYRERLSLAVMTDIPAYFQRGEVSRLEAELDEALLDDWHFAQELRDSIRLGRFPRNPGACVQYGKTCAFFDACTGAASLDDPQRFTRSTNVFPELLELRAKEQSA
jgi:hypothetical protein